MTVNDMYEVTVSSRDQDNRWPFKTGTTDRWLPLIIIANRRNQRIPQMSGSASAKAFMCIFLESIFETKNIYLSIFLKKIGGHRSLLWSYWYPCFGLQVTSSLGFKARVDSLLAFFVTCMQWIPQIHLCCNTCWPPGGRAVSIHVLPYIQALVGLPDRFIEGCESYHLSREVRHRGLQPSTTSRTWPKQR